MMGVINRHNPALRPNKIYRGLPMAHVVEDGDVIDILEAKFAHLLDHVFAVVDDMIGTKLFYPCGCLGS